VSIEVIIKVVAIDEERGVKSTREDAVTVPGKVLKLYEILGGGEDDILRRVGDSAFTAALGALQANRVDVGKAMADAGGGRIGGRGTAAPAAESAPAPGPGPAPAPAAPATDSLSSMLGLDIIRNGNNRERGTRQQASAPQRQAGPPSGPGPVGFPGRR